LIHSLLVFQSEKTKEVWDDDVDILRILQKCFPYCNNVLEDGYVESFWLESKFYCFYQVCSSLVVLKSSILYQVVFAMVKLFLNSQA
jgi:hypothetical protein